jgi:hypothetical protein
VHLAWSCLGFSHHGVWSVWFSLSAHSFSHLFNAECHYCVIQCCWMTELLLTSCYETVNVWLSVATYNLGVSFSHCLFYSCTFLALRLGLWLLALNNFTVSPYAFFLLTRTLCAASKLKSLSEMCNTQTPQHFYPIHSGNFWPAYLTPRFKHDLKTVGGWGEVWKYSEREAHAYTPSSGSDHRHYLSSSS